MLRASVPFLMRRIRAWIPVHIHRGFRERPGRSSGGFLPPEMIVSLELRMKRLTHIGSPFRRGGRGLLWLAGCGALSVAAAVPEDDDPSPRRRLTHYALTVTDETMDPRYWRLTGSNDGGQSWTDLDVQTEQRFARRGERRVYPVKTAVAYNLFRLWVSEADLTYLAELELIGPVSGVASESELHITASSSWSHPVLHSADQAFDGDASSFWAGHRLPDNHALFLECRYTRQAEVVVTNLQQMLIRSQAGASRDPLATHAPEILAIVNSPTSPAARVLNTYALTSANDYPERDPWSWQLLGSNDDGKTWATLDVRQNEIFTARYQRRLFRVNNPVAYRLHRIQIDRTRSPDARDSSGRIVGDSVQLAEIETHYLNNLATGIPSGSISVLARGDNPSRESTEKAFDGDPQTKWLDFGESATARASWVQWQSIPATAVPVVNLHRLKNLRTQALQPMRLESEGVPISWDPASRTLGFLDTTGFQLFFCPEPAADWRLGQRTRLSGRVVFHQERAGLERPQTSGLSPLRVLPGLCQGQPLDVGDDFLWSTFEGRVTAVTAGSLYSVIELQAEDPRSAGGVDANSASPANLSFRYGGRFRVCIPHVGRHSLPLLQGRRIRATGVVRGVLSEAAQLVANEIWLSGLEQIEIVPPTETEWAEWPEHSWEALLGEKATVIAGQTVRLRGEVLAQGSPMIVGHRGKRLTVKARETSAPPVGTEVELVGNLEALDLTRGALSFASYRAVSSRPGAGSSQVKSSRNEVLTEIRQIRSAAGSRPGEQLPVKVRGVITYIDATGHRAFHLQNGSDAVIVIGQRPAGVGPFLQMEGQLIECEGRTEGEGSNFAISPTRPVKLLGPGRMPDPRRHSLEYLMTGLDDGHWIEIEGVVRDMETQRLVLKTHGGTIIVSVNEIGSDARRRLIGARVRVRGVCTSLLNDRKQRMGIRLLTPSMEHVEILSSLPENPFDRPVVPIQRILAAESDWNTTGALPLLKTMGVVTYRQGRNLFLQDAESGVRVQLREDAEGKVGNQVEVVGLAEPDGFSPKLTQALVRKVGQAALPAPKPADLLSSTINNLDATRSWLEATLISLGMIESQHVLGLQSGQRIFHAFLAADRGPLAPIPVGSTVRVTGVLKAITDGAPGPNETISAFELRLNTPADVVVVARPPWWTLKHTLALVGVLAGVLALATGWITALRRKVEERTRDLEFQIQRREHVEQQRAMEQERTRVAYDLHDELGAGLTEISMLGLLAADPETVPPERQRNLDEIVTQSRQMVTALDEIVWAINPKNDTPASLATYCCLYAQRFLQSCSIQCRLSVPSDLPSVPLDSPQRHGLFLACKEALNNVARHAQATEVNLAIRFHLGMLEVTIADDGCGFAPDESAAPGADGLSSVRQRMQALDGQCEVSSQPGVGSMVRLSIPFQGAKQ